MDQDIGTEKGTENGGTKVPETFQFHYIKSNYFRVIKVDGAVGGTVGSGGIQISIFNERMPIPLSVVHALKSDGSLGEVVDLTSREGVVREVEVGLAMTAGAARKIGHFLLQKAEEYDKAAQQAQERMNAL